ncbi:hypothetical protein F0562_032985 [Nyssa sinensis]|uniref:Uncharacterized protein n=1 Tax=Nyssa sinensis TaxID=561372 RepID=A0A5J5ARM3_9ASTE|nr:hypothetical protein F0562_032985 [Nyssa sinensis]
MRSLGKWHRVGGDSAAGVASTSGGNGEVVANMGNYEDYNVLSLTSLPPGFNGRESFQENVDGISGKNEYFGNSNDVLPEFKTDRFAMKGSLRRRRSLGFFVKPSNSLESCLTAQLFREQSKIEEFVLSSVPSQSTPVMRPLLVTDGSRIISGASCDSFSVQFDGGEDKLTRETEVCLEENNTLLGTPSFEEIRSVQLPRKPNRRCRKQQLSRSGRPLHSQGSPSGMLLFFIGITTENLAQDLHEELEMKGMLTVKELANEDNQSQKTIDCSFNREPIASSSKQEPDESTKYDSKEPDDHKAENPELMSKIEAELEAELERLELNMKASSLERISDFVELDPDFEADVVQGDLRLDVVNRQLGETSESDRDASGTSTNYTPIANYAVLPWELSLRLHEVIESRLEERIKELETALENSQKRVHSLESQRLISQKSLAYNEVESSSTPESPTFIDEGIDIDRPLVINLSGEALDAYNEAYEEMIRMTETDQDTPDAICNSNHIENEMLFENRNNGDNVSISESDVTEERWLRSLFQNKIRMWEEPTSRSQGSNEVGEEDDDDDEVGKLLIKQIVEKARQGSSVVLNAHQMLYKMNQQISE